MDPKNATELIIFDFDGTLVDTAPDLVRAANLYLESQGQSPLTESHIRSQIGMGLRHLILSVFPQEHVTEDFRQKVEKGFLDVYEKEYLKTPKAFDGVHDFLHDWPGSVAIVSNKRVRFIHPLLKELKLHNIPWVQIVGGDTFSTMKPHPQPFLAAIEAAGASPETTVIVGDGIPDVEGALAIGARCVAVGFGYTPVDQLMTLGAWARIDSFHELRPLLDSIT